MNLQSRYRALAAACAGITLGIGAAHAALIAYDPFNQAVGAMLGTASSGGDPAAIWPTAGQNYITATGTNQIVLDSLLGSVLIQGNHAQIGAGATDSIFRLFGTTLGGAGSDLWLSFLFAATSGKASQVLSLFNGSQEDLAIGVGNPAAFGMSVRTGGGTTTAGNPPASTGLAVDSATHFVAVHLQLVAGAGNSTFSYFIDPVVASYGTLAPTGGNSAVFTGNNSQPFTFDRIRLGEFTSATTAFDEFRLGTTWADVSPVAAPEPSAALLIVLSSSALALFRHRRRHAINLAGTRSA